MEKVAIIEMNESNIKLVILDVAPGGYYNVFDKIIENVKLGQVIDKDGLISSAKVNETLTVLKLFRKVCDCNKVERVVSIATSFVREAKNQKSFFDEIYNNTTFAFTILNTEEEVRAIYSGVINFIDEPKGVLVDVESNYTYIIQYNRRTMLNFHAIPYGAVTFANSETKYPEILDVIKKEMDKVEFVKNLEEDTPFVGAGGIMLSVGRLAKKVTHYPLDIDNNYVVTNSVFEAVFNKVKDLDLDKTQKLKGISEDRADSLVSGMAIVKAVLNSLDAEQFTICGTGLEDGLICNYVVPEINDKPLSDMLTYSLDTIRTFYDRPNSNTENVYNLAIILFKQLKVMHKLPRAYIKALRIASSMYDCGTRVNFNNFANYSFEIIINSRFNGVSHKDLLLAGFACKYQNLDNISLSDWVKYKDILTEDDLDAVRKLGVIVNLAASLDRSRNQNVYDISCDILGDSIIMKTLVKSDSEFDIRQGMKVGADFKKVLKKYLQII